MAIEHRLEALFRQGEANLSAPTVTQGVKLPDLRSEPVVVTLARPHAERDGPTGLLTAVEAGPELPRESRRGAGTAAGQTGCRPPLTDVVVQRVVG